MSLLNTHIITLASQIGKLLQQKQWKLTTAESCTGGGLAYAITEIAGSSQWFEQGFVTYSNSAKQELIKVPADIIHQHGAVSPQTAQAMAQGAQHQAQSDIAIAITGIAGPEGGTPEKPVGTVWFGFAISQHLYTYHQCFTGDRHHIRQQAITFALQHLLASLARQ